MSWKKYISNDIETYRVADSERQYFYTDSLDLEDLNDSEREFSFTNCGLTIEYVYKEALDMLPSGVYKLVMEMNQQVVKPWYSESQKLLHFSIVDEVLDDYSVFSDQKELYNKLQVVYKRGILLYGPPGTGKTSIINLLIEQIKTENTVVIYVPNSISDSILCELKKDNRMKIIILEELTETLKHNDLRRFLTFLDGENSLSNCYVIATTNYPEELPKNLVDRPGRFDVLFKIDQLSRNNIYSYLNYLLDRPPFDEEIDVCLDLSISYIKELVLSMLKKQIDMKEAIKEINKHRDILKSSFKMSGQTKPVGFYIEEEEDSDGFSNRRLL